MTNLIAAVVVCIVTNVTTADNSSGCKMCSEAGPGCIPLVMHYPSFEPCKPYVPATEKTITTEVIEIKTLTFEWEGERYTAKRERVLSRNVKLLVKRETWVEATEKEDEK